VTK
jgi:hypothetical protein